METIKAFILIGNSHPVHGGINPTHYINIYENNNTFLKLIRIEDNKEITEIESNDGNIFDDMHFLIFSFILKKNYSEYNYNFKLMYDLLTAEDRKVLYNEIKEGLKGIDIKIIVDLLDGRMTLNNLASINDYPCSYEINTPLFKTR